MLNDETKDEGMDSRDNCGGVKIYKREEKGDKGRDYCFQPGSHKVILI